MIPPEVIALILSFFPINRQAQLADDDSLSDFFSAFQKEIFKFQRTNDNENNRPFHKILLPPIASIFGPRPEQGFIIGRFHLKAGDGVFKFSHPHIEKVWAYMKLLDVCKLYYGKLNCVCIPMSQCVLKDGVITYVPLDTAKLSYDDQVNNWLFD